MKKNNIFFACMIMVGCVSIYAMEQQIENDLLKKIKNMNLEGSNKKKHILTIKNKRQHAVWVKITTQSNKAIVVPQGKQPYNGRFLLEDKEIFAIDYNQVGDEVLIQAWDKQDDENCFREMKTQNKFNKELFVIESDYQYILPH